MIRDRTGYIRMYLHKDGEILSNFIPIWHSKPVKWIWFHSWNDLLDQLGATIMIY